MKPQGERMESTSGLSANYPTEFRGNYFPIITNEQNMLLKGIAEGILSSPSILVLIEELAKGEKKLEDVSSDIPMLLSNIPKLLPLLMSFGFNFTKITEQFNNLAELIDIKIFQNNDDWIMKISLEESTLTDQQGIVLNFLTEFAFFIYMNEYKINHYNSTYVNEGYRCAVKAAIKELFFGLVQEIGTMNLPLSEPDLNNLKRLTELLYGFFNPFTSSGNVQ